MRFTVQYFARYREALGLDRETVEGDFPTVGALRDFLVSKGREVLGEQNIMCARNEELCQLDEPVSDGDDVAFFPTVTGG